MWKQLALFALKKRLAVLIILGILTVFFGYMASKVQLSYDFNSAIPQNNKQLVIFKTFKEKFGEDGTLIAIGLDGKALHDSIAFAQYKKYCAALQKIDGVDNILSIPTAVNIYKAAADSATQLKSNLIFAEGKNHDSSWQAFHNLPFYKNLLYYPASNTHIVAVRLKKEVLFTAKRLDVVNAVEAATLTFCESIKTTPHISGLPFVRSKMAQDIKSEMRLFLLMSILLTAAILFLFFKDIPAMLVSIATVIIGVVWSVGILQLLGYKITLLTALVPPLIVVIGIPNCIYFINKYHQEYAAHGLQGKALVRMVQRMGIVTLFTNLTAAIGFGVFCFTQSKLLREFGWVTWLSIMCVFVISLFFIPAIFSYIKAPNAKRTSYLQNEKMLFIIRMLEQWVFKKRAVVYIVWAVLFAVGAAGIARLKTNGYMVDDLPRSSKLYQDLQYFEKSCNGVMPFEIWIDTKKKNSATSLNNLNKIDELQNALCTMPELGKPLSVVDAIKFARQAYYDGDSSSYALPSGFDAAFLLPYLKSNKQGAGAKPNQLQSILRSFVDSSKQSARISMSMRDVGSAAMPKLIARIDSAATSIFDTSRVQLQYTGSSVTFLEGSKFIINSLGESIAYAFLMIFACMFFLFKNWRIVLISISANVIPLIITAGVMGWCGIALKPSTVLVFSVALGITIDVTIRFLVAYKQELPKYNYNIKAAVAATMHDTGMSIIYTSLILCAGFLVFMLSQFGGTKAIGYLTSLTLLLAMFINLTILPALLLWLNKIMLKKTINDPLWEVMQEEEDIDLDQLKLNN